MTLRQTTRSLAGRRMTLTQTPFSTTSIMSKKYIKQQPNITDIYSQVKQKLNQMQSAFKSENLTRQRQMLKTYMKILDRIGQQVMQAKQKYRGLNKENLKTGKRLSTVTELNKQRAQCNTLTNNIKQVKSKIKFYQDENNYLQKQVQALQKIQHRKRQKSRQQKTKYRTAKQYHSKQLQKKCPSETDKNQNKNDMISSLKHSIEISKTLDMKNRAKSFVINNFSEQQHKKVKNHKVNDLKTQQRPSTTINNKYIGNKRAKNKFINSPLQQKIQSKFFQQNTLAQQSILL